MPNKTRLPKCCPVCGGDSLQPVTRHPLSTSERDAKAISGLLGFRCGRGHVFLISKSEVGEESSPPPVSDLDPPK